ncbi:hypothetical protein P3342_010776 [Pyrenophora teres f. teres]|nr:hypothetical protein P3342_010776 [Pyrenophora teres f. teres]
MGNLSTGASLEGLKQPMDEESKKVDQYGRLREAAHEYFCTRNGEMGKHPHILLALLVTAPQHRRRGAGSLLVQWALQNQKSWGFLPICKPPPRVSDFIRVMGSKTSIQSNST